MIVAFAGKMKSGKDTCAEHLMKQGYKKISFADNLKNMCMKVFTLTHTECYTQEGKERLLDLPIVGQKHHVRDISIWLLTECNWPVNLDHTDMMDIVLIGKEFNTAREILQYVGSEVMRMCIDSDIHAKIVKNIIDKNGWTNVVIPDCRFANEVDAVESWGGKVVRLVRPETDHLAGTHMSETSLDGIIFNNVVTNDSTLEDMCTRVNAVVGV